MGKGVRYIALTVLALGALALVASPACAPGEEDSQAPGVTGAEAGEEGLPDLATDPDRLSLSVRQGTSCSEAVTLVTSDDTATCSWTASANTDWLDVSPSWGNLSRGRTELTVDICATGLEPGSYEAVVGVDLADGENSRLTVPVRLEVIAPDPSVLAREFWEGNKYETYWRAYAENDVLDAVQAYEFPPPYIDWSKYPKVAHPENIEWRQTISFKACEYEYVPAQYDRPIAIARCLVIHRAEHAGYRIRSAPLLEVMLQVAPGPYSTQSNEWVVVEYDAVD